MFQPKFQISPQTSQALMDIEVSRHAVSLLPVSSQLLTALLRDLDARRKRILTAFRKNCSLTTKEIAEHLGI